MCIEKQFRIDVHCIASQYCNTGYTDVVQLASVGPIAGGGGGLQMVLLYTNGSMCGVMSSPNCLPILIQVVQATPAATPASAPCIDKPCEETT